MNKTIITAALTLGLAAGASAITPGNAFTLDGVHDYAIGASGLRIGVSHVKEAASRSFYHEFNAGLGYMNLDDLVYEGTDRTFIPLTVGYYANVELTDKVSVFGGARAGIMKIETEPNEGDGEDTTAPLIAIGAGLKFQLTKTANLRFAYEIGRYFISDDKDWDSEKDATRTVSLGVEIAF